MQRPALSLAVATVPIKEAKRGVAGLLHFGQQDASAHGVDRAGRQKHAIPGSRLEAMETPGDLAGRQSRPKLPFIHAG